MRHDQLSSSFVMFPFLSSFRAIYLTTLSRKTHFRFTPAHCEHDHPLSRLTKVGVEVGEELGRLPFVRAPHRFQELCFVVRHGGPAGKNRVPYVLRVRREARS